MNLHEKPLSMDVNHESEQVQRRINRTPSVKLIEAVFVLDELGHL